MAGKQAQSKVTKQSPKKGGKDSKPFKFCFTKSKSPVKQPPADALIKFGILSSFVAVVFEMEREVNQSPYLEWEAFKAATGKDNWMSEFNPLPYTMYFFKDGVKQKHFPGSDYHRRVILLEISLEDCDSDEELYRQLRFLGESHFMENLNKLTRPGKPIVKLPENDEDLIFIREGVVSDVIGAYDAERVLRRYLGDTLGAFEGHSEYVYRFFREGEIPKSSQTYLSAPDSQCMEYNF